MVALAILDQVELTAPLRARTLYWYVVLALRPVVFEYVFTFAATVAICTKLSKLVHLELVHLRRSISNPVSLFELSVHVRLIWLLDIAFAVRPLGVAGG